MISSGEEITPEMLVENIVGEGVQFTNVQYQGGELSKGIFTNGYSTNLGIDGGIILCTGYASILQGPNFNTGATGVNGTPGDATLTGMAGQPTFDAAVLEFDVIPGSDTLYLKYVFGSEEYPEYVLNSYNDVFGFFVTGPNPDGGEYANKNIAIVPGSDPEVYVSITTINNVIPSYPEFYVDNTGGLTIEYDGFTTVLTAWLKIVPYEQYHIKMAIADASDEILDSGVCLEENSLFTPFYAECYSFEFDTTYNSNLLYSVAGELINDSIFIEVPNNTDLTNLVASFLLSPGATAYVDNILQQSEITTNDYTFPVTYHVMAPNGCGKDWVVIVDFETGQKENQIADISIYPNPAKETVYIKNAEGYILSIVNNSGSVLLQKQISSFQYSIDVSQFIAGVYYLKFENEEIEFVRKVVVEK